MVDYFWRYFCCQRQGASIEEDIMSKLELKQNKQENDQVYLIQMSQKKTKIADQSLIGNSYAEKSLDKSLTGKFAVIELLMNKKEKEEL